MAARLCDDAACGAAAEGNGHDDDDSYVEFKSTNQQAPILLPLAAHQRRQLAAVRVHRARMPKYPCILAGTDDRRIGTHWAACAPSSDSRRWPGACAP